ncbi:MAG: hypothetical protein ACYCV6_04030 [Steroidobacteraceae bacterium]
MSITINDRSRGAMIAVGDVRSAGRPSAAAGLGFTWLKFPMDLQLEALDKPPAYLTQFLAEITVTVQGQTPVSLGRAQPHASWTVGTFGHPNSQSFELWLHLTGEQIEALERRRAGLPLEFHVNLTLQIHYNAAIHSGRTDARFHVNESDWAEILRQAGYLDRLIVAVDLPVAAPEQMRKAVQYVRSAHQHLIAGRYTDAVGVCRLAMESLHPLADDANATSVRTAFAEARKKMTMAQRAELVRLAVQHFANPAHHEEPGKPAEVYSRQDALFILSAAAGVVWEALGRHREASAGPSSPQGASAS